MIINDIAKKIESLSGRYSGYEVFADWIKATALSISAIDYNHGTVWEKREEEYKAIAKKHGQETMQAFSELLGMLTIALDENIEDVLGAVYMSGGLGNKSTGQFFTPFHLSLATARLTVPEDTSIDNPLIINEPATGSGGMIVAAAKVLKDRGVNYQRCMKVVAQDLDWKAVYMTYVQLSLLGIKATVIQGDTLAKREKIPPERVFYTPAKKGLLI